MIQTKKFCYTAALLFAATVTPAAPKAVAQGDMRESSEQASPLTVQHLTPNVYWVRNVGFAVFIVGDQGVIMVDTGRSPAIGKQLLEAVARVTAKPVNTVILTHCDGDHVNGLAAFPSGLEIIAQKNNKQFLEAEAASTSGSPEGDRLSPDHKPNHSVGQREDVTLDGIRLQLLHWAPAHTSGDLVAYLPAEKLVLAGDVLVMDQHDRPLIHRDKGGTSRGWVETVQNMLELDADRYVIGHEGVVGKDVLRSQLETAVAERKKVKALYDEGKSLADIESAVGDPQKDANPASSPKHGGPKFPPFAEVIYQELQAGTY